MSALAVTDAEVEAACVAWVKSWNDTKGPGYHAMMSETKDKITHGARAALEAAAELRKGGWSGLVLAPVEPTEAMVKAALTARDERIKANAAANNGAYRIGGTAPGETMAATYRAMIAAATAPAGGEG